MMTKTKAKTKTSGSNTTPLHSRPTPNYMKSTITSHAKTEQLKKIGSSGPTMVRKNTRYGNSEVWRATCSSSMKGINPGSVGKVCRYSYCSIDGHHHARLPPLKSFVSARRRALQPRRSIDIKEPEEIGTRPDIIPKSDDTFGCFFDEISMDQVSKDTSDDSKSLKSETLFACSSSCPDNYLKSMCSNINPNNYPKMALETNWPLESLVPGPNYDESGRQSPCGLQFLPPEHKPEAEKVKLRHQEADARKNAEEWMVDYALRQAVDVTKGDRDTSRHRRVALLVEAFEKVQLKKLS